MIDTSYEYAQQLDKSDELAYLGDLYLRPQDPDLIYLCGNSLGLQTKNAKNYLDIEVQRWQDLAVEGHFQGDPSWMQLHVEVSKLMAPIVGARTHEVTIMNTLTINLHLMMVSFYRPSKSKYKILVEYSPFPSDRYMLESQIEWHGFKAEDAIIEMKPSVGECLTTDEIKSYIHQNANELALVLIGGVNYYTGQYFNLPEIAKTCQDKNISIGLDLAHAVGNLPLYLHDWGVDFASWCTYKYLNGGPGSLGGVFVHEKHHNSQELPKLKGWWGHALDSRFKMDGNFQPALGVETWQVSNLPILAMPTLKASLEIFNDIGMDRLRQKSVQLTTYLSELIKSLDCDRLVQLTPQDPNERGCQLSIKIINDGRRLFDKLRAHKVLPDYRYPDVIRFSPTPMYNTFVDLWKTYNKLNQVLTSEN
jgi:kynureninase